MEEKILKKGIVGGKVKYEIYRPRKPLIGKPLTITPHNIKDIFRKAKKLLDAQRVDGYPRPFYTPYGSGRIERSGRVIFDAWDNTPRFLTKKDL